MKCIRLLVPTVALILALLPVTALASTNYHEAVSGVETGFPYSTEACPAPDSVSPFAGLANGTLDGTFMIAVCHTQLNPSAEILATALRGLTAWSLKKDTPEATRADLNRAVAEVQGTGGALVRWHVAGPMRR